MRRRGRVALMPPDRCAKGERGELPAQVSSGFHRWAKTRELLSPRVFKGVGPIPPICSYSNATGAGYLACSTLTENGTSSPPILLTGSATAQFRELSKSSKKTFKFELIATAATGYKRRRELQGGRLILFLGHGSACAALTRETVEADAALI